MGVVRVAALSCFGYERSMDVLPQLHRQMESPEPDVVPHAPDDPDMSMTLLLTKQRQILTHRALRQLLIQ